jgi:hypothetical protein
VEASKPTFLDFRLFGNDLVALRMRKTRVKYDRPLIMGMAILDVAKTFVYDFHYSYVEPRYGPRARLLFTDTDSLAYSLDTEDAYKDMGAELDRFDTSDYRRDHPCFSDANKKVVLKFKDEANGVPIREFVGLRAKMYCLVVGAEVESTGKGIKASEMKRLTVENYRAALNGTQPDQLQQEVGFNVIRARDHRVATMSVRKTGLCAFDDKRHVLDDNVHTLAHGHWRLRERRR